MKKRHYLTINLIFISLAALSAITVVQFMTGYKPLEFVANLWRETPRIETEKCTGREPLGTLSGGGHESLKKLAVYQQACHSFATDTLMVFFAMPSTSADVKAHVAKDAKIYKAFGEAGIRPVAIYEPTSHDGRNLDFEIFANGSQTHVLEAYFAGLKKAGVSDKQLGIITPFPEANLPYWNNNQPKLYAPAVNNFLGAARQAFPQAATSVLLNSATYDMDDFNWESGDYNSLLPYVKGIKPSLVDYAGIQGFPWIARAGGNGVIFNAAEFLAPSLMEEMAEQLKTRKIWFNTGTFSRKYTLDPDNARQISPEQRKEVLSTIEHQAISLKGKGYEVAVNIFAEDKSETAEETDWSYWRGNDPFTSPDSFTLTTFIKHMDTNGVEFWLFDR